MGYVPCNMVSEVQYDVENDPRFRNNPNDPWNHLPIRKMVALYDYDPQELSPNFDSEVWMSQEGPIGVFPLHGTISFPLDGVALSNG